MCKTNFLSPGFFVHIINAFVTRKTIYFHIIQSSGIYFETEYDQLDLISLSSFVIVVQEWHSLNQFKLTKNCNWLNVV